jgi:hypothetical protein
MSLNRAKAAFLDEQHPDRKPDARAISLELLCNSFADLDLKDFTSEQLRHFLSVWFLEETIVHSSSPDQTGHFPDAQTMLACLTDFFTWAGESAIDRSTVDGSAGTEGEALNRERLAVLQSLHKTLPRAIALTRSLSDALAKRGGAFTFPEFLTSFEEGGQSAYDIGGAAGDTSTIEGYFYILGVDGINVEAEESISERQISPILFPQETIALLDVGYIINLELIYLQSSWQIVNCGFAYPPDTEI